MSNHLVKKALLRPIEPGASLADGSGLRAAEIPSPGLRRSATTCVSDVANPPGLKDVVAAAVGVADVSDASTSAACVDCRLLGGIRDDHALLTAPAKPGTRSALVGMNGDTSHEMADRGMVHTHLVFGCTTETLPGPHRPGLMRRRPALSLVKIDLNSHRFSRWPRVGLNSRRYRMDWASVESSRNRMPLCAHEMAPGLAIR
jgi:hypothetical protein